MTLSAEDLARIRELDAQIVERGAGHALRAAWWNAHGTDVLDELESLRGEIARHHNDFAQWEAMAASAGGRLAEIAEKDEEITRLRAENEPLAFQVAQSREFEIQANDAATQFRDALRDLCDAFQQVYENEYGPAPASENHAQVPRRPSGNNASLRLTFSHYAPPASNFRAWWYT